MALFSRYLTAFCAAILTFAATGCTAVTDEEPQPCPHGLEIRFVYDYNLERADAFPAQVDCLTLHIYDSEGQFVRTLTETSGALAEEGYRMRVDDLEPGSYRLLAYGGIACEEAAFRHDEEPAPGSLISDVAMRLDPDCLVPGNPRAHLHDHFYGIAEATVIVAPELQTVTVRMMKNTNHFRIMLQHLSYEPLDGNDYIFEITDDNTLFDHTDDLVDAGTVTYTPWDLGSVSTGLSPEAGRPSGTRAPITEVRMAYADLSTSRLMLKRSPRLHVRYRPTGETVIDIPLNNYLLAYRSRHYDWCGEQEFLDRKSDWPMIFFLDDDRTWNRAYIKVDDWVVRVNHIDASV